MTDSLATRLETAERGSRELSDEVLVAFGWEVDDGVGLFSPSREWHGYNPPEGNCWHRVAPSPTESVDDALALVPEGWTAWELRSRARKTMFSAALFRMDAGEDEVSEVCVIGSAPSPCLALCAAVLRATQAKKEADGE